MGALKKALTHGELPWGTPPPTPTVGITPLLQS